jgi:hypothetical protein
LDDALLGSLRHEADAAFRSGDFERAVSGQQKYIAELARFDRVRSVDLQFLGSYLCQAGDFDGAVAELKKARDAWPSDAAIAKNLGAAMLYAGRLDEAKLELQRAIDLGNTSFEVFDGLAHCLGQIGEHEAARTFGARALMGKHESALANNKCYPIASDPAPAFDPTRPQANVISYSLWGSNRRYLQPLLENAKIAHHLFSCWSIRVCADSTVPREFIEQLKTYSVLIIEKDAATPFFEKLLWRFEVANDPQVRRFLVRDADSLLTVKERVAVDAWLLSGKCFHIMRDFYSHTDLILAGLWGGVGNVLPDLKTLWREYRPLSRFNRWSDQHFLGAKIWPTVCQSCIIHDSVFTGCLGSVPFPLYGSLPPGHHVGEYRTKVSRTITATITIQRGEGPQPIKVRFD